MGARLADLLRVGEDAGLADFVFVRRCHGRRFVEVQPELYGAGTDLSTAAAICCAMIF